MSVPQPGVIRTATLEDVQTLVSLGRRTFVDTYGDQNDPENVHLYLEKAYTPDRIHEILTDPDSTYLLLERDQTLVGFALLTVYPAPECVSASHPLLLKQLYIDRPWQGQGLGSALVQACLEAGYQQGYDQIWLTVWEHNPKAQAFYQRQGFTTVGSCTFIVGKDAQLDWVMCRSIPGQEI